MREDLLLIEKNCVTAHSQAVGSTHFLIYFMFLGANVAHLGQY